MINRNTRWRLGLLVLLLITLLLGTLPLASYGANGDGTGNGQGVFKPLGFISATIDDGTSITDADNVPLQPKITLHFDKNVVYLIYWERNKRCFHLYDGDGKELALNVSKIDDTVDFSKRQYIWAEPAEPLVPGTSYKLYVSPELLAKNGSSTLAMTTNNQGVTIKFKTAGEKTVQNAGAVAPGEAAPAAGVDGSAGTAPDETPVNSDSPAGTTPGTESDLNQPNEAPNEADAAKFEDAQQGRQLQNIVAAAAGVLLAGWVAVEVYRRKRK